jgi:CRISPR-associated exonuclease Cas4
MNPANNVPRSLIDEYAKFTGTQMNYYFVCKRKLWLFSHNVEFESESDLVYLGRLLHEQSYRRKFKEIQLDRIKIDFLEQGKSTTSEAATGEERTDNSWIERQENQSPLIVIHEVKRSRSMHDAHLFQLLYYIYYLQKNYGVNAVSGVLHYPLLKTNVPVQLTGERARRIENVLNDISQTISLPRPPSAVWVKACRSCAYSEMCWG